MSVKVHITMRLDPDLLVEIEHRAEKHGVDRNSMLTALIRRALSDE